MARARCPGGMNKHVSRADRDLLRSDVGPDARMGPGRGATSSSSCMRRTRRCTTASAAFRSNMLSLVRADGAIDLYDGVLRARDAAGRDLRRRGQRPGLSGPDRGGGAALDVHEVPATCAAWAARPAGTGSVRWRGCRTAISSPRPWPRRSGGSSLAWGRGEPIHATLAYHWARMIEMLHTVEVHRVAAGRPDDILQGELMASGTRRREGVGIIEAPRGTLIHHYRVGDDDLVTMCNLIVSTTHNNQAMNEAVRSVARQYLDGQRTHRGAAQPHRSRDPRLRPVPVLRHACARADAAGRRAARSRWRTGRPRASPSASQRRACCAARPAAAGGGRAMTAPLLVFGWGNRAVATMRSGLCFLIDCGPVAGKGAGSVEFLEDFQLQIEHALDLVGRRQVLFVDASRECRAPFEVRTLAPARDASYTSHAMSPQSLLQVYCELHQARAPRCTLLAIRGEQFELGCSPAASSLEHLAQALSWGLGWLRSGGA